MKIPAVLTRIRPSRPPLPANRSRPATLLSLLLVSLLACLTAASIVVAEDGDDGVSFDNLKPVPDAKVAKAYIDPTADFSVYERIRILKPYVAFQKDWKREQDRGRLRRLTPEDIERVKSDVAKLFEEVFRKELEKNHGYPIVDENGEDVLLLRPAIIDLDIAVPDTLDEGDSDSYSASAGAATLYIELFDSVSGKILGRAADRRALHRVGDTMMLSNRVTNSAEGRRLLRHWADLLRRFLDQNFHKSAK